MRPSISWQVGFLKGFLRGDTAKTPPYALVVDVTRRCNLNCLHCRLHSPLAPSTQPDPAGADFPLDQFLTLCQQAQEWGISKMVLIGEGEPLLHPKLTEMVAAAKAAGCRLVLLTNGTLLMPHHAEDFVRAGLDELRVSFWAAHEEEYRSHYPGSNPTLFHRAVEGVQAVAEVKRERQSPLPKVVLHRPIEPQFFRRLAGTVDLAEKAGCDAVSFAPLKPLLPQDLDRLLTADQERELVQILAEAGRKAQALGLSHNIKEVLQRLRIGRSVWQKLPCYIGWIDIRLRVNGNVVPCDTCDWVMGNIYRDGIREIWNNPAYRDFRRLGRRRDGIFLSGRNCICDFCCHAVTNARVHRFLRWFSLASASHRRLGHDQAL